MALLVRRLSEVEDSPLAEEMSDSGPLTAIFDDDGDMVAIVHPYAEPAHAVNLLRTEPIEVSDG